MTNEDERELLAELARLQQEHRDLDAAIDALHQSPAPDLLMVQRLKKRKLQLRDRIAFIEDQITPDIALVTLLESQRGSMKSLARFRNRTSRAPQ